MRRTYLVNLLAAGQVFLTHLKLPSSPYMCIKWKDERGSETRETFLEGLLSRERLLHTELK